MTKKFFIKRFKHYFLIIMIPSLFLLIFIYSFLSYSKIKSINADSANALNNINEKFDLVVTNAFYQHDLMTLNPQLTLSLQKILLFSTMSYTDYTFLNSMKTTISSISKSHPYIHSIYLYLDDYNNFFSSEKGVCNLDSYYDTSWYQVYGQMPTASSKHIESRIIPPSSTSSETEAITIYQRMAYVDGAIVVNIRSETLLYNMDAVTSAWENQLFILNENRDILLTDSPENEAVRDSFQTYFHALTSPQKLLDSRTQWLKVDNTSYLFQIIYNKEYELYFVLLTPFLTVFETVLRYVSWYLLILLLNFCLVLFMSWSTTRRNFRQIQYVIQLFSDAENGIMPEIYSNDNIQNEYDLIMNNVIRLFLNTTFLNSQLAEHKYKKQAAELAALQLQINPHFLLNTLQTLDFEVYKMNKKPSAINHIIANLCDILRYALTSPEAPVSFAEELANVKKYVEIQKYRFPDRFLVYYEIDDTVLSVSFLRLILQPLVENSISHGIRSCSRHGYIKIRITAGGRGILVSVIDNGIGITKERLRDIKKKLSSHTTGNGIGLSNVNQRLILHYGQDSCLHIQSRVELGTCISFRIAADSLSSATP